MRPLPQPPLLVVTDRSQARRPLPEVVATALAGGCRWFLLREKDLGQPERLALTREVATLAQRGHATLLVGADLDAARLTDGVHLPRDGDVVAARAALGAAALIGRSAHSLEEAVAAAKDGADYVTLSPIFASASKPAYGPVLGLETLKAVADALPIPVLALGGIDANNAAGCRDAGAAGVAAMGPIMRSEDAGKTVAELLAALPAGALGGKVSPPQEYGL